MPGNKKDFLCPYNYAHCPGEEFDKVLGLELGADDYIAKPFSPREVVARIKAVLRRANSTSLSRGRIWETLGLKIDYEAKKVEVKGREINLTPKEFELLWFLVNHPRRVYTREQLLEHVWGYDFAGDTRTVDTHIKRLREKLTEGGIASSIKTVWGYGYKFEPRMMRKNLFSKLFLSYLAVVAFSF